MSSVAPPPACGCWCELVDGQVMLVSPVAAKIETIDEGDSLVPAGEAEEGVEGGGDGELPLPYGHPAPRPLQARA